MVRWAIVNLGILSLLAISAIRGNAEAEMAVVDSAALGTNRNLPWSEPVQIDDPFEGRFVGVFDRHSFDGRFLNTSARIEVQSLWSQEFIRILSVIRDRSCLSQSIAAPEHTCSEFTNARNITELFIKIEDDVFQLTGQGSTFPVSHELAEALQNAPETNISIRLVTANGEMIDSEIGQGTVDAWRMVYR